MRHADEEKLREILSRALERTDVPPMPRGLATKRVRQRQQLPRVRWWLSSAAVLVLMCGAAFAHERIAPAQAARPVNHVLQQAQNLVNLQVDTLLHNQCEVEVSTSHPTILDPLGTLSLQTSPAASMPLLLQSTGETLLVSCGSTITLAESPTDPSRYQFAGWVISGDGGIYRDTVRHAPRITLKVTGAMQVTADYVKRVAAPLPPAPGQP